MAAPPDAFAQYAGDNDALLTAFRDFEAMRKSIKAPLTSKAKELLVKKLSRLTNDTREQISILEQSTLNSWKGVFPLKQDKPQSGSQSSNPFLDLLREGVFDE